MNCVPGPTAPDTPESPVPPEPEAHSEGDERVLVGVCTYNEAENIEAVLDRLRHALPWADLLVVDDASPDGTARLAQQWAQRQADPSTRVLVRKERGLGGAIRCAIGIAVEDSYDYFLNLDGDLSHDPDQLPNLLDAIRARGDLDVVIGSRYVPGGSIEGWPLRRKLMSRMVNRFATGCLRLPVKDCSGSMRCYRVSTLRRIDLSELRSNGYALLEELLVRLHEADARMLEVPITFTERRLGASKLTLGETCRAGVTIVRLAIHHRGSSATASNDS